jgi:YidC/Oxa1 family membrane protein insertase
VVEIWQGLINGLAQVLVFFEGLVEPLTGANAWGWGIVLLTLAVRLVLLPLTIKQTSSMRGMQRIQPEMTKIREKYKADRSLLKTDPERYRALQTKQQEELSKLMREHNVNPAGGCLPLLAQMPILFALYQVFINRDYIPELLDAPFYFINRLSDTAAAGGGVGSYALLALMGITTYIQTRQTAAMQRGTGSAQMQQQQQMLQYVMPALLVFFGYNLPAGVLLYWVTTNLWTMGQQYVMFRTVAKPDVATAAAAAGAGTTAPTIGDGATSGGPLGMLSRFMRPQQPQALTTGDEGAADTETTTTKNGASPSKGAPTPKRSEARQQKGSSRDAGSGRRRGNGDSGSSKGKGGGGRSGASTRPKR